MFKNIIVVSIICLLGLLNGCFQSRVVPPGMVVIVLKPNGQTITKTSGTYTAWGRDKVYLIDTRLKSFTEHLKILCKDRVNMSVDIKWLGHFKTDVKSIELIKEKVPSQLTKYDGNKVHWLSLGSFYNTAIKDIIRSNTREVIAEYSTDKIRDARSSIQKIVRNKIISRFQNLNYPINTVDVMISNLDYPKEVTKQLEDIKRAQLENKKQEALSIAAIAQAKRQASIAREQGKAMVEKAKAEAKTYEILGKSLNKNVLMLKQLNVLEEMLRNQHKGDLLVIPYSALGDNIMNTSILTQKLKR